jgi:hypothetical protein
LYLTTPAKKRIARMTDGPPLKIVRPIQETLRKQQK